MICPPAGEPRSAALPSQGQRLPAVDKRLAPPETRVEYLNGAELFAAPADEPHASQHSQIDRVVGAHVKSPYGVAVDMLTRTSDASDFAADVSVYEPIFSAKTGAKTGRKLEEIVFEVVDRQAATIPTRKAVELTARGVRRIFAVFVREKKVYEWSRAEGRWEPIEASSVLEDPCFVRPITARALVDWLVADDEVAKALLVKRPPSIQAALDERHTEGMAEGHREGHREGQSEGQLSAKRESILRILEARGLSVPKRVRAAIESTTDIARLDRWLVAAITVERSSRLLDHEPA